MDDVLGFTRDPTGFPEFLEAGGRERASFRFHRALPQAVWEAARFEGSPYTLPEVQTLIDGVAVGGHSLSDEEMDNSDYTFATLAGRAEASEWFIRQGHDRPELATTVAERGIDPGAVRRLGIGWAPDSWHGLVDHLSARGHARKAMLEAGVAAPRRRDGATARRRDGGLYDVFRSRVMFTITDTDGHPVGFAGRLHGDARGPKYLNTASTALLHRGEVLYGGQAITPATQKVVIVQGPWDANAITYSTGGRAAGLDPSDYTAMFGIEATQKLVAPPSQSMAMQIIDRRLAEIQPGSDPATAVNAVKGVVNIVRGLAATRTRPHGRAHRRQDRTPTHQRR